MIRITERTALLLAASFALAGPALAKKKKGGDDAPASADTPAAAAPSTPDDKNSQKFGAALVAVNIENWSPSDGGGAKFSYTTMSFNADNSWNANGYVEIADERMECTEAGGWTMEPADSATVATVNWTVDKTDCPGRDAGKENRAVITIGKSGIEARFR